ncbi:unnamed protein product [Caenorhabditis brenneri]
MKIFWLLVLLLTITASATQERKRRLCGRALHLLLKRVCPTPCDVISDIANHACSNEHHQPTAHAPRPHVLSGKEKKALREGPRVRMKIFWILVLLLVSISSAT